MPRRKPETKRICGVLHIRVTCTQCKGRCWTQTRKMQTPMQYVCNTCFQVKEDIGVGRGMRGSDAEFD